MKKKNIEDCLEDITLRASKNPLLQPCFATLSLLIEVKDRGGYRRKRPKMTQVEQLIQHLDAIGSITQREAYLEYNIQSFHRRLSDLRAMGLHLKAEQKKNPVTGQDYTRYSWDNIPVPA